MIQQVIDAYVKAGGRAPFAILMPVGVYDDIPPEVFVAWTPLVRGVVCVSLSAASVFVNERVILYPETEETKETEDHA